MEVKRRLSAEINFAGLCCVELHNPPIGQAPPKDGLTLRGATVFMVDTKQPSTDSGAAGAPPSCSHMVDHLPRLNYYFEDNLESDGSQTPIPCPDGREVNQIDLTNQLVEVLPPYPYEEHTFENTLARLEHPLAGGNVRYPRSQAEDQYLDWTLTRADLGLTPPRNDLAVTEIHVPPGVWECRSIVRNKELPNLPPLLWELVGSGRVQAIGAGLRLKLPGLRAGVRLRIKSLRASNTQEIQITPGPDGVARLSFTNLPSQGGDLDENHLSMFRALCPGSKPTPDLRRHDQLSIRPPQIPCYAILGNLP